MSDSLLPVDNAVRFLLEIVEPTVAEFMTDKADKRRACLACLALASLTEHYLYARFGGKKDAATKCKTDFYNENNAVKLVADVANATRHVVRWEGTNSFGCSAIESMEIGQCGIMRCGWPIGGEEVLVGDEREWRLSELVESTMRFWHEKLDLDAPDE